MPSISDKGRSLPLSPIRKLVPFAEAAKKRGVTIHHLNIGQPDIGTSPLILEAVRNNTLKVVEYSHSAGNESYRKKLTGYYKRYNILLDYSDILITTGGSEALLIAMMCCLNPGDEVIVPEPFYANYNSFARLADARVVPIVSSIRDGFALPSIESFEKAITSRTRAILICNPNNPTGYLYSRAELEALKKIVIKHDLFLLSDEVYREFCYDDREYCSVMHLEGLEQHTLMLDSISKRYSACGLRIGAIVSKNKEVLDAALRFAQARLSPPSFGQIGGEAAIDTPASYFEDVRKEYVSRRDLVVEALNKIPGVYCPRPSGAFYVIAKLPVDNSDTFCQWLLESFNYHNETVMLAPATGFYSTPGGGTDEVRIAYVLNTEKLNSAMKCLEEALKIYPGRTR